jgi:hypothetical protein
LLQKVLPVPDMPISARRKGEEIGSAMRNVLAR